MPDVRNPIYVSLYTDFIDRDLLQFYLADGGDKQQASPLLPVFDDD
jgi:hypothetical protein